MVRNGETHDQFGRPSQQPALLELTDGVRESKRSWMVSKCLASATRRAALPSPELVEPPVGLGAL